LCRFAFLFQWPICNGILRKSHFCFFCFSIFCFIHEEVKRVPLKQKMQKRDFLLFFFTTCT